MTDNNTLPNYTKFLFASLAGVGSTIICYPLDFVKTRLQVFGKGDKTARISSYQIAKDIIHKEGVLTLYTGLSASILRQASYTGVRMGAYQTFVDYFSENGKSPSLLIKSACGVVSGVVGGVAGLPSDVALTRMAADGAAPPEKRRNYTNVFNAMFRIFHEEGFLVLYRGITPVIVRSAVVNISQLVSYSQAKETLLKLGMEDNTICHISCSIISAVTATTCVLPPDIAKTRMQNMTVVDGKLEYKSMLDVWFKVVRHEGFTALWKGYLPLLLRNGPQFLVLFILYENLTKAYKKFALKSTTTKT